MRHRGSQNGACAAAAGRRTARSAACHATPRSGVPRWRGGPDMAGPVPA